MTASKRALRLFCRALLVPSLLLSAPRAAHAEHSAAQKETARTLMAEGRELRAQADLNGALTRFQAADAIMSVPTTGFEVARAQADLLLFVEARATIRRLLAVPAKPDDPEPFEEARSKAEALDTELDARIASMRFIVSGLAPGAVAHVTVDGESVPAAALAMPFRVNPGAHRIVARSAGAMATRAVSLAERQVLDVPLALSTPAAPPPAAAPAEPKQNLPTVTLVAGGVAAAGLIVGSVTGLLALAKTHDAEAGCRNQQCPPKTWSDLDSAHSLATVSSVSFVVAAVSASVSVGGWLFTRADGAPAPVEARISVTNHASTLSISGNF